MAIRFVSLFSGIGGMELGIKAAHPGAVCVAHSEIDEDALTLYNRHFPKQSANLGDIRSIRASDFYRLCKNERVNLIVAGFPCSDLSMLANLNGVYEGLHGPRSGLFFDMLRLLRAGLRANPKLFVIIENNASMRNKEKETITQELSSLFGDKASIHMTVINAALFSMQHRRRIFWTNFPIDVPTKALPGISWNKVLSPLKSTMNLGIQRCIQRFNRTAKQNRTKEPGVEVHLIGNGIYEFRDVPLKTNWQQCSISDTSHERSHTFTAAGFGAYMLIDRRGLPKGQFRVRRYSTEEVIRMFGFPEGYVDGLRFWKVAKMFAKTVVVPVIAHVSANIPLQPQAGQPHRTTAGGGLRPPGIRHSR